MKRNKVLLAISIIVALTGVYIYFKAFELKNIKIVKSVVIRGSREEVFDMVRIQNNFPKWSPYLAQDPTQKYLIKGTDG